MSWAAGDLARCIDVRDLRMAFRHVARGGRLLKRGMMYPVLRVSADQAGVPMLDVGERHGLKYACRFVKVPPLREEHVEFVGADVPAGSVPA